jgi:hypothetical protein
MTSWRVCPPEAKVSGLTLARNHLLHRHLTGPDRLKLARTAEIRNG